VCRAMASSSNSGKTTSETKPVQFIREYFAGKLLTHDIRLQVNVSPSRFAEQAHFALHLDHEESTSVDPVFSGLYSAGRPSQSIQNWVDGDYFDTVAFPSGTRLSLSTLGFDAQLFIILGQLIHAGGSLMVSYSLFEKESRIHRDTKFGLDRGYPPVVTPIGFLLFIAGCGMGFKDWYFAEGGREGPEKLQGYKPIDSENAKKKAGEMLMELAAFLSHTQKETDPLMQSCRLRATQVIGKLQELV
jgi:hypothetical protein